MATKNDAKELVDQVRIGEALGLLIDKPTLTLTITMKPEEWMHVAIHARKTRQTMADALANLARQHLAETT